MSLKSKMTLRHLKQQIIAPLSSIDSIQNIIHFCSEAILPKKQHNSHLTNNLNKSNKPTLIGVDLALKDSIFTDKKRF